MIANKKKVYTGIGMIAALGIFLTVLFSKFFNRESTLKYSAEIYE